MPRDFSAPCSPPKFSSSAYFRPPPPTSLPPSLPSFPAHSIFKSSKELPSLSSIELRGDIHTRLEEGGEFNVEGMWRGQSKRNASSQMQKQEKKGKLPPFSAFFFFSMIFFSLCFSFFYFVWEEEDAKRKCLKWKGRSKKVEARTKNEKVEWELKGKLPPFSTFFFFSMVFFSLCFFFLLFEKKKMLAKIAWNEKAKTGGKS